MAKDILDFWYTTEFLYQKGFEFPEKCDFKKGIPYVNCKEFQNDKITYAKRILHCGNKCFDSGFVGECIQSHDSKYTEKADEATEFAFVDDADADVYVCFGSVSREDIRKSCTKYHRLTTTQKRKLMIAYVC